MSRTLHVTVEAMLGAPENPQLRFTTKSSKFPQAWSMMPLLPGTSSVLLVYRDAFVFATHTYPKANST